MPEITALSIGHAMKYPDEFRKAPVMMHSIDDKGCLIDVTDYWLEQLGYSREEVIGKKSVDFLTPESAKIAREVIIPEFYRTGSCKDVFYRYVKKNGEIIDATLSATSIKDESGKVLMSIAVIRDITLEKKLEDELASSEAHFRQSFNQSPVGAAILDMNKSFLQVNKSFCDFLGYDEKELVGKTVKDVTYTEDENVGMPETIKIAQGKLSSFATKKRYKHKEGYPVWGEVNIGMVRDHRGEPSHFMVVIQDIDHDVKRESEMLRLKHMYQNAAWGMIIVDHDSNKILDCNKTLASMHGYTEQEMKGMDFSIMFTPESLSMLPSVRAKAVKYGNVSYESVHQRRDGSSFPCFTNATMYKDDKGKILFRAASLFDISEKKQSEDLLKIRDGILSVTAFAAEQFLKSSSGLMNIQAVLGNLGTVSGVSRVYIFENRTDTEGRILSSQRYEWVAPGISEQINNQLLQDLPLAETGFSRWITLLEKGEAVMGHTRELPETEREMLALQEVFSILVVPIFTGSHWWGFIGFDYCRKEYNWSDLEINALKSTANMIGSAIYRLNSETELKKAKEKAEESERLKTVFLANMSHEIRTPMNAILGFSEMLTNPDLSEEDRARFSRIVNNRSEDLMHIINDILEISRIESGNAKIHKRDVNLNTVVGELYSEFSTKLNRTGKNDIRLQQDRPLPPESSWISSDPQIIRQVFSNLIDNAIKYTMKGSVRFGYQMPENGFVTCFVSDTGVGISTENQKIIFEHFRQADETRNKFGGTGLGLAICKGALDLIGGTIRVESEIAKGSTFSFTIPCEPPLSQSTGTIDQSVSGMRHNKLNLLGKRLLLVEDEPTNMDYLKLILRSSGAELSLAFNGGELRKYLPELSSFDLILLDMRLPDVNGWELAREIKNLRPEIPVIAQTAYALPADHQKSLQAGCDGYISKPIEKEKLFALLSEFL